MDAQNNLSFAELAILAMTAINRPVTVSQLWAFILDNKLHHQLLVFDVSTNQFSGKTPKDSFRAIISADKLNFQEVPNTKPKKYVLRNNFDNDSRYQSVVSKKTVDRGDKKVADKSVKISSRKLSFHERDLHPILAYFLKHHDYFKAYSKTIFHEESQKGTKGEDKWLYPDMVAVNFEYANYQKDCVLKFIEKFDKLPIKIFSFEIKKELNFSNYKESFFQAVSNSSWANEGYLVATNIKDDHQFIEALQKLSQSFGIGIIKLSLDDVNQSKILSPATFKENMDYSVISELANKNHHFAGFLKTMTDFDVDNPNRFKGEFDKILSQYEFESHLNQMS